MAQGSDSFTPSQMPPSPVGRDFAQADVGRAAIGPAAAGRIILEYAAAGAKPDAVALLAGILKSQAKVNTRFIVTQFQLGDFVGPPYNGKKQQILPDNPLRQSLILVPNISASTGGDPPPGGTFGGTFYLFEPGPLTSDLFPFTDFPLYRSRAISSAFFSGAGLIEFNTTPTNPVTIVVSRLSIVQGIIIEGI